MAIITTTINIAGTPIFSIKCQMSRYELCSTVQGQALGLEGQDLVNNTASIPVSQWVFNMQTHTHWSNFTHIVMIERAEHLEFTIHSATRHEALKHVRQFLQSNSLSVTWVSHRPETKYK